MSAIETDIWIALKSRMASMVVSPSMTVFDPDAAIDLPKDASNLPLPFIIVSDLRNDTDRRDIRGRQHVRTGTLAITVQWPIAKSITHMQLIQIGGTIAAHFPADTRMPGGDVCLRVSRDADVLQPRREGSYHHVTVRVPWTTL